MRVQSLAIRATLAALSCAATGLMIAAPAVAAPLWPGGPEAPFSPPGGQAIFTNPASASISPGSGQVVGGKRAIDVHFGLPVVDQDSAAASINVSSSAGTTGHVEWTDSQNAQWVPDDHWARGETVTVNVKGTTSQFKVSDQIQAVGDIDNYTFTVSIGGDVVRSMPASFGKPGHETPRGTFKVLEKQSSVVMDSSTYGVPVDSPEGYRLTVDDAVRLTWSGIYVHSAPWSVGSQGNSNVSHGCVNLSPDNAAWFFDIVRVGDSVTLE